MTIDAYLLIPSPAITLDRRGHPSTRIHKYRKYSTYSLVKYSVVCREPLVQ